MEDPPVALALAIALYVALVAGERWLLEHGYTR
jgi:hypothetical protein